MKSTFIKKFKHAFAMTQTCDVKNASLPKVLDKFAHEVVDRHMETPVLLLLDTFYPLNFIGSQLMFASMPFVKAFLSGDEYLEVARALENRQTIRLLSKRIVLIANEQNNDK